MQGSLFLLFFLGAVQVPRIPCIVVSWFCKAMFACWVLHKWSKYCHNKVVNKNDTPLTLHNSLHIRISKPQGNGSIPTFGFISLNVTTFLISLDYQTKAILIWYSSSGLLFSPLLAEGDGKRLCCTDPAKAFVASQGRKGESNDVLGLVSMLYKLFSCKKVSYPWYYKCIPLTIEISATMDPVSSVGVSLVREALFLSAGLWSLLPVGKEWRRWSPMGVSAWFPVILWCLCLCNHSWAWPGNWTCSLWRCMLYRQCGVKQIPWLFPYN